MRRILYSAGLLVMWWGAALMFTHLSGPETRQAEPIELTAAVQTPESLWMQQTSPALLTTERAEAVTTALEAILPEGIASTLGTRGKRDSEHETTAVGPACYPEVE